jgi:hypothetical protein
MPNVILFAQRARGITKRSVVKNLLRYFVSLWLTPRSANVTLSMTKQDHLFCGLLLAIFTDYLFRREQLDCVPTEHFIIPEWGKQLEDCVSLTDSSPMTRKAAWDGA